MVRASVVVGGNVGGQFAIWAKTFQILRVNDATINIVKMHDQLAFGDQRS